MRVRAEVFTSATTRELRSYREEVKNALLTLGIFPIEQTNFRLAQGPLTAKLRTLIASCDAVIHLAGFYYGTEPSQRPSGEPRRSYTQIEYDVARDLRNPLFLFLAAENCEFDDCPEQSEEERTLQLEHRRAIEECDDVHYSFANHEDLARLVRELELPDRSAEAPRRVVNLPYNSLGPLFKGRDAVLADLSRRLRSGPCQAIHGLGGVGKTRLAIEYAWRHASDYTALLFVSARSPVELRANLAGLCNPLILNLQEQTQPEEAARVSAVFRWLGENPGWLLILDNADTQEAASRVEQTLPRLRGGQVIVTSRIADWITAVQPVELDVLAEEDAVAFLLERTESRRKKTLTDGEDAAVVARDLGGLALALEQGGAYVAKIRVSFLEYRRRWESRKEEVLAWHDERLMQYPKSVSTTWQTTIEELSQSERKLLNILAWLAPEPIPLSLLEGNIVDGADARDALAGLASWSLARWMADGEGFTVHRLVQEITRQRLSDNERHDTLDLARAFLNRALPSPDWDQKGWRLWEQLAPHCRNLLNRLRDHVLEPKATRIMNDFGLWLNNRAEHGEAEQFYRRALAITEKSYWTEHPNVASVLSNLAELLQDTNRLGEAEPLYRRALSINEKSFGPEHPAVALHLNNLAGLLQATNRLGEAEPLMRRALEIDEKGYGSEHPAVALHLNNLAGLLHVTNRLGEAEPLYRRALEIDEKSYGPEHPNVARDLNNLAELLRETNRLGDAEPLYRRALSINEKSYGPEHPTVAIRLNNLALLLHDTNRLEEAEPLYWRALSIDEKRYGLEHPTVARDLNSLALLLKATNRLGEAESLSRRQLQIFAKFAHWTGHEHPHFRAAFENYVVVLKAMGLSWDEIMGRVRSATEGESESA